MKIHYSNNKKIINNKKINIFFLLKIKKNMSTLLDLPEEIRFMIYKNCDRKH